MTARDETREVQRRLRYRGIEATFEQANTLRRAELTLQRWAELKCGDGNDYASWAIERDEDTGIPYRCVYPHTSNAVRRERIADREAGALRRVAALCAEMGIYYFHQSDPRGCALHVSAEPLTDSNYTNGVACCA